VHALAHDGFLLINGLKILIADHLQAFYPMLLLLSITLELLGGVLFFFGSVLGVYCLVRACAFS
jgi:hypothetical protein